MACKATDYLSHYGVKGMKWGVRKAYDYVKSEIIRSRNCRRKGRELAKKYSTTKVITGLDMATRGSVFVAAIREYNLNNLSDDQ